jgi:23S rRNA (adenine-N6)-dimethyltransferase
VAGAGVAETDLALDLGSGTGALTRPLAERGARVIAVELHPGRAARLGEAVRRYPAVTVVVEDVLDVPLPRRPFRVVSNPPYAICAQLVRRLTHRRSSMVRADLVVPRWMARRYAALPPRGFHAEVGRHVPARAFVPAPRADSAVLVLRRHGRPTR